MAEKGWISLHRKLLKSDIFKNEKMLKVWIYCLLKATHEDYKQLVGLQVVELKAGEFIFGRKAASLELGIKESTLWKHIKVLERIGSLTVKSNNKFSVIKIENYTQYQGMTSEKEQQNNNKITTKEQQSNTNNNNNNINNINKENIRSTQFESIINLWNNLDKNISEIQTINSGTVRHKLLKARINEYGEEKVLEAINNINNSSFLKGYQKDWKITFDWFIKPNNFIKVLEGNYNDIKAPTVKNKNDVIVTHSEEELERQRKYAEEKIYKKLPF